MGRSLKVLCEFKRAEEQLSVAILLDETLATLYTGCSNFVLSTNTKYFYFHTFMYSFRLILSRDDDNLYTIVNVHLPFEGETLSKKSYDELFKQFLEGNVIICGDFNTRSKVDDTCLGTAGLVETCDVKFEKKSTPTTKLEEKLKSCKEPLDDSCKELKDFLLEKDYLRQYMKLNQNGYEEGDITFLPSYKVTDTGVYQLSKKGIFRSIVSLFMESHQKISISIISEHNSTN
jgi:hypothetical protein